MAEAPSRLPRRGPRLAGTLLLALVTALSTWGCKGRPGERGKARQGCTARRLKDVRHWLADLCAAKAKSFSAPHAHWRGLRLARAGVTLKGELPRGVLIHLTRQRLLIDGKPAPDWPKPRAWRGPDLRRGAGPVLGALLPALRSKLSTDQRVSQAADAALQDLQARAGALAPRLRPRTWRPRGAPPPGSELPSGLTLLTLTMAKLRLPGKAPRVAHLAIAPEVELWRVVQLQPLLLMAGFEGVYVLFTPRAAPDPPAPPDPQIHGGLGALVPGLDHRTITAARQRALAREEAAWVGQGCAGMRTLRKALNEASVGERCRTLQTRLPAVLKACRCARDERALLTFWLAVAEPFDHLGAWHGSLHARARPVLGAAHTVWRDVADQVAQRQRKTLWFGLR